MFYFAKIIKEADAYLVSFPEFPNINTYGETLKDAMNNAEEALNGCIESDFQRGYKLSFPKKYEGKSYYPIYLKPHIEIAYKIRKLRANKSQIEIAKKLGISYQAYQKLENPRKCNPTLKTLEKIAKALDKKIEFAIK